MGNKAKVKGGAVYYNLNRPAFEENKFTNNTASYGPDIASYPVSIVSAKTKEPSISIENVASGITYSAAQLVFHLVDFDNQTMVLESESTMKIVPDSQIASITGTDYAKIHNGVAAFKDLVFKAEAGVKIVTYRVTSKAIDDMQVQQGLGLTNNLANSTSTLLNLSFRYCKPGEIVTKDKQCEV